jgi:hypothetical protein
MSILMALANLDDSVILPTTVGIKAKKPPFAMPFEMTNTTSGARLVDTGQMTSRLMAFQTKAMIKALIGPIWSDTCPKLMRPTAEARLKPATRPADELGLNPILVPYMGRKKGATKRGKSPMAAEQKKTPNLRSRNSRLYGTPSAFIGEKAS